MTQSFSSTDQCSLGLSPNLSPSPPTHPSIQPVLRASEVRALRRRGTGLSWAPQSLIPASTPPSRENPCPGRSRGQEKLKGEHVDSSSFSLQRLRPPTTRRKRKALLCPGVAASRPGRGRLQLSGGGGQWGPRPEGEVGGDDRHTQPERQTAEREREGKRQKERQRKGETERERWGRGPCPAPGPCPSRPSPPHCS